MLPIAAKLHSRLARRGGFRPGDERLQLLAEAAQWYQAHEAMNAARALFEAIQVLAPNNPLGNLGLGEIALLEGDLELAARRLEAALTAANTDRITLALVCYRLAQCRRDLGDDARARDCLEKVRRLDPDGLGSQAS